MKRIAIKSSDELHSSLADPHYLFDLSDRIKTDLHVLMSQHEKGWRGVAAIVDTLLDYNSHLDKPAPTMAIYQAVAYETGKRVVTIRMWHHYWVLFGGVLDELPCLVTITQMRLVLSEAHQKDKDPLDVLRERVSQAADFGKFIPPDVYDAELGGHPNPYEHRDGDVPYYMERVVKSLTTAVKRDTLCAEDKAHIVEFIRWLEDLQKRIRIGSWV